MISARVPLVIQTGEAAGQAEVVGRLEGDRRCVLRLWNREFDITEEGTDFFEGLCKVRAKRETRGLFVASYGGSRTVSPAAMGRDMGLGLKAFRHTLGQRGDSLVDIFDTGPDVEVATVEQQRAFYLKWLSSIGSVPETI